jgi:hypothetical protein
MAKAKTGRPSSYKPEFAKQVTKLCLLGATDADIADFFGVAISTIYKWKHEYPEFSEAQKSGKDAADERVERSLYNRAVGYTFESEKVFQFQGQIVRTPTREHVPPDTTAGIFWLKNRRSGAWRDVQKHEHGGVGDFDTVDDETLAAETKKEMVALGLVKTRGNGNSTSH